MKPKRKSSRGSRQGGFTLIEVLIALMIASLLIGFAVSQVGQIATDRLMLQERLAAETVAWNKLLEQYQLVEGWVQSNAGSAESSGTTEAIGREWDWSLTAESTFGEDFYRYEVEVFPAGKPDKNAALMAAYFIVD